MMKKLVKISLFLAILLPFVGFATSQTSATLKSYFQAGSAPTQSNFTDLIDSTHFSDNFSTKTTTNLPEGTNLYFTVARVLAQLIASNPAIFSNATSSTFAITGITNSYLATNGDGSVISTTSLVSSIGGASGTVILNGTTNQINVSTTSNSITLSTPQSINTNSAVRFGTLAVSGALQSGYTSSIVAGNTNIFFLKNSGGGTSITLDSANQGNSTDVTISAGGVKFWQFGKGIGDGTGNFYIYNNTRAAYDLSVASSTGSVGIGTTTPQVGLVVATSSNATSTVFISGPLGGRVILKDTTGGGCTSIATQAGAIISKVVTCPE